MTTGSTGECAEDYCQFPDQGRMVMSQSYSQWIDFGDGPIGQDYLFYVATLAP